MGANRRYAARYDENAIRRIYERAMADGEPTTLAAWETDLANEPVTTAPDGQHRPVHAWVRYSTTPVRINGRAFKWTDHAVAVR